MVGIALSFLLAPLFVPHDCADKSAISGREKNICILPYNNQCNIVCSCACHFQRKPEKPPSLSQANKLHYEPTYKQSLTGLCKTKISYCSSFLTVFSVAQRRLLA
uniref:U34-Theraphotoxin-Sfo1a_1 n=1 Tax=Selenotholus foelschei TaxID=1905327 RepID=A0A482ZIP6_9ARAC